jgi:alpha-tubulin suppressor-like RCC1 family protein
MSRVACGGMHCIGLVVMAASPATAAAAAAAQQHQQQQQQQQQPSEQTRLYGWGDNDAGQLHEQLDALRLTTPRELPGWPGLAVWRIACGWSHSALITRDARQLYTWGSNRHGQLGRATVSAMATADDGAGDDQKAAAGPRLVDALAHVAVRDVACGWRHTICAVAHDTTAKTKTTTTAVYAWGANRHGQLGTGDVKASHVPRKSVMPAAAAVAAVCCGQKFSCVLTSTGDVLTCGSNAHGQLGTTTTTTTATANENKNKKDMKAKNVHCSKLVCVNGVADIVDLACGWSHVLACTASGTVFSWGRGDMGQLGDATRAKKWRAVPHLVALRAAARRVFCGAESSFVVSKSAQLFAFGWNEHGNLGLGHTRNVLVPTPVKRQVTQVVVCGGAAVLIR